ncbi:MAG: condensation domain-containing protein, partial [Flammeovirgaceae bacterium]
DTDLFEAGLNSIVATQMVARIHASTGVSVALHEVFETTNSESFTVKALVRTFETASAKESDEIQIISKRELYDVSYVQRRLWLLEKLNGGRFPSSIPLQIIFREALDITAIEKSLDTLLLRHPSFRTEYIETEDGLFQKIADADNCKFRITVEDIGGEEDIESILKDIGRQEAKHIFELSGDLLLNFRLVRISPDHFRAFITFHHIATDGWSASIVLREFFHLYDCFTKGLPNSLVPVQIQYTDYAVWLNSQIDQRISGDRNFWMSNISGLTERTHLPNYNKRPSVKSYEGKRLSFKFPESIVSTLLKICSEEDCTLFTALTATLNVLFHRYNSTQSVVLGTSVSNRGFGGSENLVGYFLSVLALKTEVSANHTFSEILAATRTTIQQAYKHQHYPFDQIVNDLQLQRDSRYNPIFDVVVLLHNYENPIVPDSAQFDSRESRIVLGTDNETCITDVFLEF